jgi:BioD-like phosphotransacetylase family protein
MGARHIFFDDTAFPVHDINLSMSIMADFILIDRYMEIAKSIYTILSVRSLLKEKIKGIILNRVPREKLGEVRDRMGSYMQVEGTPLTAIIPEEPALTFRTLDQIRRILDGTFLCGEEKSYQTVEGMTTGASTLGGDLKLLKRVYNKIVLLSPQARISESVEAGGEIQIAAIILTGGQKPAVQILEAAKKAGIPVILVKEDTFGALERMERSPSKLSPDDRDKVDLFTGLFNREGMLDRLLESL